MRFKLLRSKKPDKFSKPLTKTNTKPDKIKDVTMISLLTTMVTATLTKVAKSGSTKTFMTTMPKRVKRVENSM